jgi:hypothetical protein
MICVVHCSELRWSMGRRVFRSGVGGRVLCACMMELYIIG